MKIWHKILVAPGVAIVFLMILGAMSYSVLMQQHSILGEMFNTRFASYQLAANSSQEISEVHSNVYRLFTWLGHLDQEKIKQITDEQKAKIDAVTENIAAFSARTDLDAGERDIAQAVFKKLAKYKNDVDTAIDLAKSSVRCGAEPTRWRPPQARLLLATLSCLPAPKNRRARWKKPLLRWKN
jgi:methyl-accepting chemotaxis protein